MLKLLLILSLLLSGCSTMQMNNFAERVKTIELQWGTDNSPSNIHQTRLTHCTVVGHYIQCMTH
jgi:hypothetical protein